MSSEVTEGEKQMVMGCSMLLATFVAGFIFALVVVFVVTWLR
jgi:hypothetical protein